jgi:Leucine-rich repeat (LRR) protein
MQRAWNGECFSARRNSGGNFAVSDKDVGEMLETQTAPPPSRRKRRVLSFTLRGAMLALTVLCLWLGLVTDRARKQTVAVGQLANNRGEVGFAHNWQGVMLPANSELLKVSDDGVTPGPLWLRQICGNEYFRTVTAVKFAQTVNPPELPRSTRAEDLVWLGDLPYLTRIDLGRNRDFTDAGLAHLASCSRLESLLLNNTAIDGSQLTSLKKLRRLTLLSLATTPLDDEGAANLAALSQLTNLDLSRTLITDAAVAHLAELPNLETLSLRQTDLTDACVESLRKMKQLKSLDLSDTYVTIDAIYRLMKALPNCTVEPSTDPSSTSSMIQLDPSVRPNNLYYNGHDQALIAATTVKRFRLFGSNNHDRAQMKHLPEMPELEILRLEGLNIGDRAVADLPRFENLRELDLNRARVSDRGLPPLARLKHLERLSLVDAPITDNAAPALAELRQLRYLDLSGARFTAAGVDALRKALPQCEIRCVQPMGGR